MPDLTANAAPLTANAALQAACRHLMGPLTAESLQQAGMSLQQARMTLQQAIESPIEQPDPSLLRRFAALMAAAADHGEAWRDSLTLARLENGNGYNAQGGVL